MAGLADRRPALAAALTLFLDWSPVSPSANLALGVAAVVTLALGIYPAPVLDLARLATRALL